LPHGKGPAKYAESALLAADLHRAYPGRRKGGLLIIDNQPVHHAKLVTAWLAEHFQQIEDALRPPLLAGAGTC
jgi:hypothetical protein